LDLSGCRATVETAGSYPHYQQEQRDHGQGQRQQTNLPVPVLAVRQPLDPASPIDHCIDQE
jgi:hypothetical protein